MVAGERDRISGREPEHLVLARPVDRGIEQAGDADPVRQSTFDRSFDEGRREEGQRDRHIDVARAAGLRAAISSIVAVAASISDSHWRSRAIAVTSLARVSERIGRARASDEPSRTMRRDGVDEVTCSKAR
jgi:hypothetical protein